MSFTIHEPKEKGMKLGLLWVNQKYFNLDSHRR